MNGSTTSFGEYEYEYSEADHISSYVWAPVLAELETLAKGSRILDLGCGNGAFAKNLASKGYEVVGIDPSESGIHQANSAQSDVRFEIGSAYDDLRANFGEFDCVVSLEVIEHLYSPLTYVKNLHGALRPGGPVVISTPYHSYLKNLVMALSGKMDKHFTALWEHGHIKFFSVETLTKLLSENGLLVKNFHFVGRFRACAKSMIAVASKVDEPKNESV